MSRCHLLPLALLAFAGAALGLSDVRISVPAHVLRGSAVRLTCRYQLDGERLYAVKWYKGRHEFYRFTPSEQPSKKAFPPLGAHVDLQQSGSGHVTLTAADDSVSGRYSCEVSADAPSFHTLLVSNDLEVVDAPRQRPHLVGMRAHYRPGDWLNATCIAGASRPPAALAFLVNDVQQDERSARARPPLADGASGLWRSRLALSRRVSPALGPRVRVRCVASIGAVYWQSAERAADVAAAALQPESSGDWRDPPGDDDGDDDDDDDDGGGGGGGDPELQWEVEGRQHAAHGGGRRRGPGPAAGAAASTAAPRDEPAGAAAAQLRPCSWQLLVVACLHLHRLLQLQLRRLMAAAPA